MTASHALSHHGNARAIFAIVAAGAFFTVVDTMMKLVSARLPVGEAIVLRNVLATALIFAYAHFAGGLHLPRGAPWKPLTWRMIGEGGSTITFLSALAVMPIADAAGIAQFGPLAIMAAAAVFLGEHVGWRRWLATLLGFLGVMLIIRPGTSAFEPAGLLVLAALALNIMRDFVTRGITSEIPTLTLTAMSSLATLLAGCLMLPFETWVTPSAKDLAQLAAAALFLLGGYAFSVICMRNGEVSAATPFRYTGMLMALLAGWVVWREVPDTISLAGIAIVCVAGLYTVHREQVLGATEEVKLMADRTHS